MTHRIAFIGMGTIGRDVRSALAPAVAAGRYTLGGLSRSAGNPADWRDMTRFDALAALLAWRPSLVVEVAGQEAVRTLVPACLRAGCPTLVTSVGALADDAQFAALRAAAAEGGVALRVPAGAVASLDYLQAVRGAAEVEVTYESRKPVDAWRDELDRLGMDAAQLREPLLLFAGSAREAALRYPKNLNVAATVALACAGMEATQVRVVVDPAVTGNQHIISVRSPLGCLTTKLLNQPAPTNPKTSWIVAQSVASAIERQFADFVIA